VPKPSRSKTQPTPLTAFFGIFLGAVFLYRLAYGLCSEIWFIDQQQVYLIGLKYYATGLWPFFGADVAPGIQLPGALQGLVVGLPLVLFRLPEAPTILLNLLSFGGLCFFAWYCSQRLPQFPRWILWTWLLTAPWVMNWSTNIDNDSYALFGGCLFFIGFLETIPALTLRRVPPALANALMGLGLFWNVQFHMSYVILIPYLLVSFYFQAKFARPKLLQTLFFFSAGALVTGSFLIPTLLKYGLGAGGAGNAIAFNPENLMSFPTVLARFLSLASCEIPRFLGAHNTDRLEFLETAWWVAPFAVVAALFGIIQTLILAVALMRNTWFTRAFSPLVRILPWLGKNHPQKDWPIIRNLTLFTFLLIYGSFLFAIKAPAAHTYFLTLPIAMLYGFYVFSPWVEKKWFLKAAKLLLACNILFHMGLAVHNFQTKSLYKNRGLFMKAIEEKNYLLLGERRPDTLY